MARRSARTGGSGAIARSAAARRSAHTGGCGAFARSAAARRSARTGGSATRAATVGGSCFAPMGATRAAESRLYARVYPQETFSSTEAKACAGGVEQAEVHEDCSICLEPLDGEIVTTPCAHTFHSGCIQDWLLRGVAVRCPLCNGDLEELATKLNITPRRASSSSSSSSDDEEETITSSSSSSSSSSDDEDSEGEEDRTSSDDGGYHQQDEEEDEEEEHGDEGTARVRELLRFHAPVRFTVDQIMTSLPIAARMTAEEWAGLCDQNVHLTGWGTRLRPYRYGWTESSGNNIDTGENSTTTANAAAAATAAATAARKLERDFLHFKRAIEEWSPPTEEPDDIHRFDC